MIDFRRRRNITKYSFFDNKQKQVFLPLKYAFMGICGCLYLRTSIKESKKAPLSLPIAKLLEKHE